MRIEHIIDEEYPIPILVSTRAGMAIRGSVESFSFLEARGKEAYQLSLINFLLNDLVQAYKYAHEAYVCAPENKEYLGHLNYVNEVKMRGTENE